MSPPDKRSKGILDKLVLPVESRGKRNKDQNEFDATKPVVLFWLTISYIGIVFFLFIGVPWMGVEREPIPPEDLPFAITVAVILYIVIIGGLYLRDRLKK